MNFRIRQQDPIKLGSFSRLAVWCGAIQVCLAVLALAGWYLGASVLASLHPRYLPMGPAPAFVFLVLGVAVLCLGPLAFHPVARKTAAVLGGVAFFFGLTKLIEDMTGMPLAPEHWWAAGGRIGQILLGPTPPLNALNFMMGGLSVVLLVRSRGGDTPGHIAGALAAVAGGGVFPILLGALYGTNLLYGNHVVPLRLSSALCFLCLNVGLIATAGAERFPLLHLVGNTARARLLRAFLPVSGVSVLVHGLIHQIVPEDWGFNSALLSAVSVVLSTSFTAGIILYVARIMGGEMDRYEEERRRSEELLAVQRHQLIESAKLSALGEMAAGIAHEINTPLMVINGRSALLKLHAKQAQLDHAAVAEDAEKIENTSKLIAKIVSSLKRVSRDAAGDPFELTPIDTILASAIDLTQERYRKDKVTLHVPAEPSNIQLECRASQIIQVLLNLLNNAHDAVEALSDRWVKLSVEATDTHLEIRVEDSGPGIPPEIRERLSQPFFTTKPAGKGTGLGLSISRGILEAHGGRLRLSDELTRTCFIVRLPLRQAQTNAAPVQKAA